jgi:hypothetical protein
MENVIPAMLAVSVVALFVLLVRKIHAWNDAGVDLADQLEEQEHDQEDTYEAQAADKD